MKTEKMTEITEMLKDGIATIWESDNYKRYLDMQSRFHRYSFNNVVLLMTQKADCSMVTGYRTWQKMKRSVKRGEKALYVLAPVNRKYTVKKKQDDGTEVEEIKKYLSFKPVPVFDVSQTEGEELPSLKVNELTGGVDEYSKLKSAIIEKSVVPIKFCVVDNNPEIKGCYNLITNDISIKPDMSEMQTLKTMFHEEAHAIMHSADCNKDRHTKEMEAESVAYIVSKFFGLDTSEYSFNYIAGWSHGKDDKTLEASMKAIQKTADTIINMIA